jgi:hypothetical protein
MEEAMRRVLPGVLLVTAVAVAGCGGNPKKERQQFLAKANAICNQFETQQNEVRFPSVNPLAAVTSHADRARWGLSLKQIVDLGREEVKSLRKLKAPKDLSDRFQQMVDSKDAAFGDLARAADAAKRNHPTQIKAPADAGRAKLAKVSKLAKALGAPRCA